MPAKILVTGGSGFIGSYLIGELLREGKAKVLNIDISEPIEPGQMAVWRKIDILDEKALAGVFESFCPDSVIHLAAFADTDPKYTIEDYKVNTEGTANVLKSVQSCPAVKRLIVTSTQFVHQYKGLPKHDEDYAPHTVYGESKVISENLVRKANLDCCWTIIRPTNIWGPRHPRYPREFWHILKKGRYIHPGKRPVIRSYGYVGNVVDQIIKILNSGSNAVNKQVFYVGDVPINLLDWVNGFSLALTGKEVRVVPRLFVKCLALMGDVLQIIGIKFPITSSRYKSMTHSNTAPMEKTISVLGEPKFSLQSGINETVSWLKGSEKNWVK